MCIIQNEFFVILYFTKSLILMINQEIIKKFDLSDMMGVISNFHLQVRNSIEYLKTSPKINDNYRIKRILIAGMGGSAISGDLARSFIAKNHQEINLPIMVVRNYDLPNWVDEHTLVLCVSYSGNTEETLSIIKQAKEKTHSIVGIASGGQLAEFCNNNKFGFIQVPGGMQPRAALGHLFFAVYNFIIANFCKVCTISKSMIEEQILADFIEAKSKEYSNLNEDNLALHLAEEFHNKQVVIYSSSDVLDVVNLRWRGQLQENSKNLAFGNLIPEMNHNEINSLKFPKNIIENTYFLILVDKSDNPSNRKRIDTVHKIISEITPNIKLIESKEEMAILRIFDLIYLADWVSFYLGILNEQDPTEIELITRFKKIMSE